MTADARTLGWLTRALQHEFAAVQQYLAQATLARMSGYPDWAERLQAEAMERSEERRVGKECRL